jgi:hypothetical protein
MAQRLNKLRFHRIIVILEVFKRWAAMEADSPALFATPLAPHRRIYPSCYTYTKVNTLALSKF